MTFVPIAIINPYSPIFRRDRIKRRDVLVNIPMVDDAITSLLFPMASNELASGD